MTARVLDEAERDMAKRALAEQLRGLDGTDLESAHAIVVAAVRPDVGALGRMTTARMLAALGWRRIYPILPPTPEIRYARTPS